MGTAPPLPPNEGGGLDDAEKPAYRSAELDAESDDKSPYSCRVCWEGEPTPQHLVSPCRCSGTQKHVHLRCLRRWQENVQKRDATDERAFRCSVCRSLFSTPPPQARGGAVAVQALRGIGGVLCISLLAFGLSGPPWPHLALLVLLLLASRSHWLPGLGLLMVCSLLATMHARGLRLILRVDGGGRLGLALIRQGAPVAGVGPGERVLLVASEGLDHSIFRRSVVLLTQHGSGGARGVILTQPMTTPPPTAVLAGDQARDAASEGAPPRRATRAGISRGRAARQAGAQEGGPLLKHFLGGPVGMPGEGVNHEILVLHSLAGVEGARRILPPPNATRAHGAAAASAAPGVDPLADDGGAAPAQPAAAAAFPLYVGGSMSEIVERAAEAAAAHAATRLGGRPAQAGGQAGEGVPHVLLFHGVCAWAEGQLEGELRSGAWSLVASLSPGVLGLLGLPPDQLWQALVGSPQLGGSR